MQTFLAKCTALSVLLGGFFVTGDVSRLAEQGMKLVNATNVPEQGTALPAMPSAPLQPVSAPLPSAPVQPAPPPAAPAAAPAAAAPVPQSQERPVPPAHAPLGRRINRPAPPADAPAAIEVAGLRAGDRLLVWLGRSSSSLAVVAYDIVDPVAREALEQRHLFADDAGGTVHAAPRRVRLSGNGLQPGLLVRGGMLGVTPLGIVHAGDAHQTEQLGPVQAMAVQR